MIESVRNHAAMEHSATRGGRPKIRSLIKHVANRAGVMPVVSGFARLYEQSAGQPWRLILPLYHHLCDYRRYSALEANPSFLLEWRDWFPCLGDRTSSTVLEPVYFYQDVWGIGSILKNAPERHVDVGSSVKSMALLSRSLPVTFIDIRKPDLLLPGMDYVEGSILELPFPNESVDSLSSLCVVEHIGLGRYGDPLDPYGSEKAFGQLRRVLKPGGHLYISVPVDSVSRVCFNAHRCFSRDHLLSLLSGLRLVEERYIYGRALQESYDPNRGFGTGLFHFRKNPKGDDK
jgi:SAM-dependent methyltransferase